METNRKNKIKINKINTAEKYLVTVISWHKERWRNNEDSGNNMLWLFQ